MYRFLLKPRWVALTLICLILLPCFKSLSDWQWRRLHERQALNKVISANINKTLTGFNAVGSGTQFSKGSEWTTVQITGRWDAAAQVLVRKKSFESDLGFWVVTPFVTQSETIIVNRGWIAAGNSAVDSPTVQLPPVGEVTIQGRVRLLLQNNSPEPKDLPVGQVDRITPNQIETSDKVVTNGYLELVQSVPDSVLELKTLPAPEISEGPHRSYALQWIFFAIMTIVGWTILVKNEVTRQQTQPVGQIAADASQSTTHHEQ